MAAPAPRPDDGIVEAGDATGPVRDTERIDIERLGRQRPAVFASTWTEAGFVLALLMSMMISVRDLYPGASARRPESQLAGASTAFIPCMVRTSTTDQNRNTTSAASKSSSRP